MFVFACYIFVDLLHMEVPTLIICDLLDEGVQREMFVYVLYFLAFMLFV